MVRWIARESAWYIKEVVRFTCNFKVVKPGNRCILAICIFSLTAICYQILKINRLHYFTTCKTISLGQSLEILPFMRMYEPGDYRTKSDMHHSSKWIQLNQNYEFDSKSNNKGIWLNAIRQIVIEEVFHQMFHDRSFLWTGAKLSMAV